MHAEKQDIILIFLFPMSKPLIFGKIHIYDFPSNIRCCEGYAKKLYKTSTYINSRYKLTTLRQQGMLLLYVAS